MGMLKVGQISVDGTKITANASKHRARSWGHLVKIEKWLQDEVKQVLALAEREDGKHVPDGLNVPQEIARREERLAALGDAKRKLAACARERDAAQQAEFDATTARRDAQRKAGKRPRGTGPEPPATGPQDKDQISLTDEHSRIMKVSGGGVEQCYNGQCVVDADSLLIVATGVTQACNDKEQIKPMLATLKSHAAELGRPKQLSADTGFFGAANVNACMEAGIEPLIARGREAHYPARLARWMEPAPLAEDADGVTQMAHRLKTRAGRADYALRKQTVEPVFGVIKHVMKFRQCLWHGVENVHHEWNLVALAWNLKRMSVLNRAS